jgi:alanine racemase
MVRPGLIIYGLYPKEKIKIKLKPVLSLKTRIIYLKRLPKGSGISYGHIYVTKKESTIVTLPIGYGDGYPRNLSNLAPVLIGGRCFQISGRVCMDQIMVDVGDLPVKVGQEVTLIGRQGKNKITCEELAELAGTIPYEIACGLGSRIPRVYVG